MEDNIDKVYQVFEGKNVVYSDFMFRQFERNVCTIIKVVSSEKCPQDLLIGFVRDMLFEENPGADHDTVELNLIKSSHNHKLMAWPKDSRICMIANHELFINDCKLGLFLKGQGIDFETGKKLKNRTS
jgi:hypothetical protein